MITFLRKSTKTLAGMLPAGAPEFIYEHILRGPLRTLFNKFVLALLPKTVVIPEGIVVLNSRDPIVSGAVTFGVYEPFESELFREAVKPGMTVVDIGANIGYFTVIAAKRVTETGRVIAFEAEPNNYAVLQKTIAENGFKNTRAYQTAIADRKGTLTLNLYDSNMGKHSLVKDSSDAKGFSKSVEVSATDLDSFLAEQNISTIDIIKMDIEGAESLALGGMQKALTVCKILFMEFTPTSIVKLEHNPEEILAQLKNKGFNIYKINGRGKTLSLAITDFGALVRSIPSAHAINIFCKKN